MPLLWLTLFTLLGIGSALWSHFGAVGPATSASSSAPKFTYKRIEHIKVADWVLARNPETAGNTGIDYGKYDHRDFRVVQIQMQKPDGGDLQIQRLMSLQEMEHEGAIVNQSLQLTYPELGICGSGTVVGIVDCPPFKSRPSADHCLVTTTFFHSASHIIEITITGESEPLEVTPNHPFWSNDRQEFVQASELQPGEALLTASDRIAHVSSIQTTPDERPVYNLEVDGENVYHVGKQGTLVHNSKRYTPVARRWNSPININGRRVYQRNDLFDVHAVDANGMTNLQRMRKGRPPIGHDGESINLHHLIQEEPGPIAEVGGRFHSENTRALHGLAEDRASFRYSADGMTTEAEKAFRRWSYRYWQDRARGFE